MVRVVVSVGDQRQPALGAGVGHELHPRLLLRVGEIDPAIASILELPVEGGEMRLRERIEHLLDEIDLQVTLGTIRRDPAGVHGRYLLRQQVLGDTRCGECEAQEGDEEHGLQVHAAHSSAGGPASGP